MNIEAIQQQVRDLLDATARQYPEGVKAADLGHAIVGQVATMLGDLERDLFADAEALIRQEMKGQRRQRRKSMAANLDYLLDAFAESEESAYVDPYLDLVYPIGTEDGHVKTLRYWTAEDFDTSIRTAYRKAAEVTAAAREHDESMTRAVHSMRARGVSRFGEQP